MDAASPAPKKIRTRSPNYPAISLPEAVDRARVIHDREGRHPFATSVLATHWKYSNERNGAFLGVLAALKRFGLLDEITQAGGSYLYQLSRTAREILHGPVAPDYAACLREAALKPDIHQVLWTEYQADLPSDASLTYMLSEKHGFNRDAIAPFIKQYKDTLAFAKLDRPDAVGVTERVEDPPPPPPPDGQDARPKGEETPHMLPHAYQNPLPQKASGLSIMLGLGVMLNVDGPMTRKRFERLKKALDLFEEDIVSDNAAADQNT